MKYKGIILNLSYIEMAFPTCELSRAVFVSVQDAK
jgi:hypothetical protein